MLLLKQKWGFYCAWILFFDEMFRYFNIILMINRGESFLSRQFF